ncbi:hypothetical protein D3Z50_07735 [Clostridiaceae bacterium]|nr:hypothetical protein [Clostridiaceae bacterium]
MKKIFKCGLLATAFTLLINVEVPYAQAMDEYEEYRKILSSTDYLYYTLYDIDKDGSPELLLCNSEFGIQGSIQVYTYKNNGLIDLGSELYTKYSLHAYEGNGIICDTGGTGVYGAYRQYIDQDMIKTDDSWILDYSYDPFEKVKSYYFQGSEISEEEYNQIKAQMIKLDDTFHEVTDLIFLQDVEMKFKQ